MRAFLVFAVIGFVAPAMTGSFALAAQFPPFPTMPEQQRQFIAAIEVARKTYNNAANDMAKGAARPARAKEICSVLKGSQPKEWVGVVYSLSTNGDGKGVMKITVGPDIYVKTWNNSFSDASDRTLIDPNSEVFKAAVVLKKGQKVAFSGKFFKSPSDCIEERSLTLRGSIKNPEFIVRFSAIKALED